jgi:hypothetical protein
MEYPRTCKGGSRCMRPWLISKFVDKNPEFIFVPADKGDD